METKKIIITSILTTLSTLLVVAIIMHLCCGNCGGRSSCSKAKVECRMTSSDCKKSSACADKSKCDKKQACADKSKCDKEKKCCKSMTEGKEMVMEKEVVKEEVKK